MYHIILICVNGYLKMENDKSDAPQVVSNNRLFELAQALADPLRLIILQHLMSGAATVSELVALTGEAQSKVSNHLALLRERELVIATRQGRQMVYELKDLAVGQLVESLTLVAGTVPAQIWKSQALIKARTCYDHLAGRLGVTILKGLVSKKALLVQEDGQMLELGPAAPELFGEIGINLREVAREKRKFAYNCLDWTERQPHLGGGLGAAIWVRFMEQGWVLRQPGSRALVLSPAGQQGVESWLGFKPE